jgi:hypothetical protein
MVTTRRTQIAAAALAVFSGLASIGSGHAAPADLPAIQAKEQKQERKNDREDLVGGGIVLRIPNLKVEYLSKSQAGDNVTFSYRLKNEGTGPAHDVVLEKVCVFRQNGGGGSHMYSTNTSNQNIGTVAAGASATYQFTCDPPQFRYVYGSSMHAHTPSAEWTKGDNWDTDS